MQNYMTEEKFIDELKRLFLALKEIDGNPLYVFLSKRFLSLYQVLVQRYPEITLPNCCLNNGSSSDNKSPKIYINDINYELPSKIKRKDKIIVYNFCFNYSYWDNEIMTMVTEEDKEILSNKTNFVKAKYLKMHRMKFRKEVLWIDVADTLGREYKLLEDGGIKDPICLLPDCLQNYFQFIIQNQEYINFFLEVFYSSRSLSCDPNRYQILSNIIVNDMIQIFGNQNINTELIHFLLEYQNFGYSTLFHSPLSQDYPSNQQINCLYDYQFPIIEDGKVKRLGTIETQL